MDSLGRLGDMLEPSSAVDTERLSTEFKAAARHLTSLFRLAQGTATSAHRAGYLAALSDIKAGLAARAASSPNDSPQETIDWLHRHLSARADALTTPEDPDDDPAPDDSAPRPPGPPSLLGTPPPQQAPAAPDPPSPKAAPAPSLASSVSLEAQRVQAILSRPAWTRAVPVPPSEPPALARSTSSVPTIVEPGFTPPTATESAGPVVPVTTSPASTQTQKESGQPTSTPSFDFSLPPGAPRLAPESVSSRLGFAAYAANPGTSFRRWQDRSASVASSGLDEDSDSGEDGFDDASLASVNGKAPVLHARPPVSWPERKRPRKPETPSKAKRAAARRNGPAPSPHGHGHGRRRRRDDRRALE